MASSTSAHLPLFARPIGATLAMLLGVAMFVGCGLLDTAPAFAQSGALLRFPDRPKPVQPTGAAARRQGKGAPMLLQAREIQYDYTSHRVAAVGNVQIYYGGSTMESDKVEYDETTKRLHAEGNVRLTEADGKITYGQMMDLSEDFRDGFVDSLRLDAPDQTRFAAARADRTSGKFTVFQSGVYTACEPCKDDPKKPPFWQVRAARIIHNEGEKMIYFENARLEFMGVPTMYMPYFSAPDPTVKRKTGWLMPNFSSSSKYGLATKTPYYWALAPDRDVTISPMITSKQGLLMEAEYRQRFEYGAFMIRGSGIDQMKKDAFNRSDGTSTPGFTNWRGSLETSGQFALSDKWQWGWDGMLPSDKTYFQDYNLPGNRNNYNPILGTGVTEGVSQLFVTGKGNRSFFDARTIYYYGFSEADSQGQIPVIHPVVDYNYTFGRPVLGGELGYNINFTSLSRNQASFDPITQTASLNSLCQPTSADPNARMPASCLMRGIPGTYSRLSAETRWKRTITDSMGQMFTPFVTMRGDFATLSVKSDPGVSNYIAPGDSTEFRGMPTAGIEYRYPFINVQSWGTQTLEPIAQLIVRPDEPRIGKLPNEDSQSLIFDDSNLFRDKFTGWDRIEGGGRANVGMQYTAQANRGGFVNAMFGQSYQLFGLNSYAVGDATNTGLGSGLDTARSDYVARVSFQPDRTYTFTTRYRFDESSFTVRRFEAESRANYDRWIVTMLYGYYAAQPQLGFLNSRSGILGSMSYKLSANWVTTGALRYDLEADQIQQYQVGVGYVDDCFILALNYITDYGYSGNPTTDHRIMLQMSLRTLGGTAVSQNVGSQSTP
jgi:LPS-assembly protein